MVSASFKRESSSVCSQREVSCSTRESVIPGAAFSEEARVLLGPGLSLFTMPSEESMPQFVKISTSTDAGFGDSEASVLDASLERRNCGMGSRTAQTAR